MAKKFEEFKLIEDEELFRGKIKESLIKTVVKSLTTVQSEDFGLNNWNELQELLKSNLSFAKSGIKIIKGSAIDSYLKKWKIKKT